LTDNFHFIDSALVDYHSAPNNDASEYTDSVRPSQLDVRKNKTRSSGCMTPMSYSESTSACRKELPLIYQYPQ